MYNIYVHNLSSSIQQWLQFHGGLKPVVPVILQEINMIYIFKWKCYNAHPNPHPNKPIN